MKLPKLPKFKVSTTDILESGKTPEQIGCEIISMALVARDGEMPSAGVVGHHVPDECIPYLISNFNGDDILCQIAHRAYKNKKTAANMKAYRERLKEPLRVMHNAV